MSTNSNLSVAPPESKGWQLLLVPFMVGSLVALTLGVYGNLHEGTGVAVNIAGFTNHAAPTSAAKVTLTSGALLFALLQLASALVMYGKIPRVAAPSWIGGAHRWSGRVAFLLAVPVAVHCLYAAGFATFNGRVLLHSLLGCLFFGAFVVKMLGLRKDGMPGWFLPTIGGVVFTALVGLWWTTAVRFFSTFGSPF
jgi:hypothetical protein